MRSRHRDRPGNGGLTFAEFGFGTAPLGDLGSAISEEAAQFNLGVSYHNGQSVPSDNALVVAFQ